MGNFFQDKCYIRKADPSAKNPIEHIDWIWPNTDSGAWEGPKENWFQEHQHKWFKYVQDYRICVQAGGCMGMYPKLLAEKFDIVYTFEPTPISFYCLANNCQDDKIIKFQAALGEVPGFVSVVPCESNYGATTLNPSGSIPILTLDSLQLPHCGLIALDVEGYEIKILQGAFATISSFKPVIVAENGIRDDIRCFLNQFGYQYREHSAMDHIYAV